MGFSLVLIRPDSAMIDRYPKELWKDSKYTGNREFYDMASEDADWHDNGILGNPCYRPKDLAALRAKIIASPPADCHANISMWLHLIDVLEANPDVYLDWC